MRSDHHTCTELVSLCPRLACAQDLAGVLKIQQEVDRVVVNPNHEVSY